MVLLGLEETRGFEFSLANLANYFYSMLSSKLIYVCDS